MKTLLLKDGQHRPEYGALPTHAHLVLPAFFYFALTNRPIDKPAELATFEFPSRALSSDLQRTLLDYPTGGVGFILEALHGQKKEYLSFNMHRDVSPPLLKTLYGFCGGTEQLGHLFLRFPQMASNL